MLIALDWGTTSLRAALLRPDGSVIDRVASADGIMAVGEGGFPAVFAAVAGRWLAAHPGTPALACGMIGSRQGWLEAPYVACPAGWQALAAGIAWTEAAGVRIGFVPGLRWEERDVMRGEETQIAGALARLGESEGTFLLPGTHSKWVSVEDGTVRSFRTFMTGEVFAVLRNNSILGRLMTPGDPAFDTGAFDAGVRRAGEGAVLNALFSARTEGLFGHLRADALPSYLSGLLVGEEVREALGTLGIKRVVLVCSPALAKPYRRALDASGVAHELVDGEVAFDGLHAVAHAAGLLQ